MPIDKKTPLISGDQSVLWDALLKLMVLLTKGFTVKHSVHTADLFSRPLREQRQEYVLSNERYCMDGNVNRWTASLEGALFLGCMPLELKFFQEAGVDFYAVARRLDITLDEVCERLTASDWVGLSHKSPDTVAHGLPTQAFEAHAGGIRKRQFTDFKKKVLAFLDAEDKQAFIDRFNLMTSFKMFEGCWGDVTVSLLKANLEESSQLSYSTTVEDFADLGKPSRMLQIFLAYYEQVRSAYNEVLAEDKTGLMPLRDSELPFYIIVEEGGKLKRVDLLYTGSDSVEETVGGAAKGLKVVAVLGKAITLSLDLRLQGPLVLMDKGSSYMPTAINFAKKLETIPGLNLHFHPILRLEVNALDCLSDVDGKFCLPDYLSKAFDAKEMTFREFGNQWRQVVATSKQKVKRLSGPIDDLIHDRELALISDWGYGQYELLSARQEEYARKSKEIFSCALPKENELKKAEIQARKEKKEALITEYDPKLLEYQLKSLRDEAETNRAMQLRQECAIVEFAYWNSRPFTHWVLGVPGWFDVIASKSRLVVDPATKVLASTV